MEAMLKKGWSAALVASALFLGLLTTGPVQAGDKNPFANLEAGIGQASRIKTFWTELDQAVTFDGNNFEEGDQTALAHVRRELASDEQQRVWAFWSKEHAAPLLQRPADLINRNDTIHMLQLINKINFLLPNALQVSPYYAGLPSSNFSDSYRNSLGGSPAWAWMQDPPLKGTEFFTKTLGKMN